MMEEDGAIKNEKGGRGGSSSSLGLSRQSDQVLIHARASGGRTNTNSSTAAGTISTADDDATINVATMAISRTATSFNQNDKNLKKTLNNLVEDVVTSVFF